MSAAKSPLPSGTNRNSPGKLSLSSAAGCCSWAAQAAAAEASDWGSRLRSPLRSHLLSTSTSQR